MTQFLRANASAHFVVRVLIVSYFIALALGLIRGTDFSNLLTMFLPEMAAIYIARFIVLLLSGMILFGVGRRVGALLLSLALFWASYIALYAGNDIGAFWRDLALIGGLLLTADITGYADAALASDDDLADDTDTYIEDDDLGPSAISQSGDPYREDFQIARNG